MKKPSIDRVGMDSGSVCSSGASRADAALDVAVSEEVPRNPWMVCRSSRKAVSGSFFNDVKRSSISPTELQPSPFELILIRSPTLSSGGPLGHPNTGAMA